MSYMVYDGKIMSLSDFCLSEAILPRKTEFGTNDDMNDGKTKTIGDKVHHAHYAFFKGKNSHHAVSVDNHGVVGVGTSDEHTLDPFKYDDSRRRTKDDAKHFFGSVMHVVHNIADRHGIKRLSFDAAHPKLGSVYGMMVKSPATVKSMKDHGWSYGGKSGDVHHFDRK